MAHLIQLPNYLDQNLQNMTKFPCVSSSTLHFILSAAQLIILTNSSEQVPNTILWLALDPHQLQVVYFIVFILKSLYSCFTSST